MTKKVLIVDDEDDVRTFLNLMLSAQGADVREARGGVEGLEMMMEFQPDIVVMDYMMPEMSGEAAALSIRTSHPSTWIVGFSGVEQRFTWADRQVSKGPHAYEDLIAAIDAAA
jgi:CheY-like chemotaxis protein